MGVFCLLLFERVGGDRLLGFMGLFQMRMRLDGERRRLGGQSVVSIYLHLGNWNEKNL